MCHAVECAINESDCTDDEARYSSMDDLIPVFLVICFGVSVTACCFLGLRLGNAKEIVEQGLVYNKDLLNRVKLHRKKLAKMNNLAIEPPLEHPEDYVERRDKKLDKLTPSILERSDEGGDEEAGEAGGEGGAGKTTSESDDTGKSEEGSNKEDKAKGDDDEEGEESGGEDSSPFLKSVANSKVGVPEVAAPATPV